VISASEIYSFESSPLTAVISSGDVSIPSFYANSLTRPSFLEFDDSSSFFTVKSTVSDLTSLTGSGSFCSGLVLLSLFYCKEIFFYIFSFIIGLDFGFESFFFSLTVSFIFSAIACLISGTYFVASAKSPPAVASYIASSSIAC